MAVKSKVVVIDRGMNNIISELHMLDNSVTKVGFPESAPVGKKQSEGSGHEAYSTISEVAQIGIDNEFGKKGPPKIPARPFMSTSFDEGKQEIIVMGEKVYKAVTLGRIKTKQAMGILGELGTKLIKKKITDLRTPGNADLTIKLKGSSNPLIDTGQMRASVTHTEVIGK